jgi:hypothetical protein
MTTIQSTSQISPANERVYHQSSLLGDWKGTWRKNNQSVEFKVINIRGNTAQVEYTHNGRTERGTADVNGDLITFGNVTFGSKNGQKAALEFSFGTATPQTAILDKQAAPTDQNNLVGNWNGLSRDTGQSILFQVKSINGNDAQVSYTANGITQTGTASVFKNTVVLGTTQISSSDGKTGTALVKIGHQTFSIPVTKIQSPSTSSSVNKLA